MARLEFWYEFASPYSYLSAMRIEALAEAAGAEVDWHPFLLGPLFKAQGWNTSPFNLFPAKGRHMVRDMERLAAERNLDFALPKPFPANSLYAARLALVGKRRGWIAPFTKAVFKAAFGRGEDIACAMVLENAVSSLGIDVESANAMATAPETKEALREETASAQRRGIFGAPTFIAEDGELFWGDDRLEQAFAWLRQT